MEVMVETVVREEVLLEQLEAQVEQLAQGVLVVLLQVEE
jgi:hypothetical protein